MATNLTQRGSSFLVDTGGATGTDYNLLRVFGLPNGDVAVALSEAFKDGVAVTQANKHYFVRIYGEDGSLKKDIDVTNLAPSQSDVPNFTFSALSNGNIVFAHWSNSSSSTTGHDAYFRIIDANGTAVIPETRINGTAAAINQLARGIDVTQLVQWRFGFHISERQQQQRLHPSIFD